MPDRPGLAPFKQQGVEPPMRPMRRYLSGRTRPAALSHASQASITTANLRRSKRRDQDDWRTARYLCEALEQRVLLTTLHGGDFIRWGVDQTYTGVLRVFGSPLDTVEVIGAQTDMAGATTAIDLTTTPPPPPGGGGGTGQNQVANTVYALYISRSTLSTAI